MEKWINIISAIFVVVVAKLFGGYDKWILALITLAVIDYISGILSSIYLGKKYKTQGLSSFIGFKGILKKSMMFFVVGVAAVLDNLLNVGGTLRLAIIGFFISNEGISLLENAVKADLPIPDKLVAILKTLKDDSVKNSPFPNELIDGAINKLEELDEQVR